jgi:hypothetical protein
VSVSGRDQAAPALTAVPSGTSERRRARRAGLAALVALAAAVLFFCYWRQSQSVPLGSDGSSNVLQAWAMLHGNLLLHNWWVSDVSFYTTELPQYALIAAVLGLSTSVVHVAAAMTYTLLVLLAAALAKGSATGRAGLARALLAAGIMLAPQLTATGIVLLSPDHTGTAVPVLLTWLVIDRAGPRTARLVPIVVCVILAWTMVADSVVLITCIAPLVLVCALRACLRLRRRGQRPEPGWPEPRWPEPRWYEPSLAGAAAVAAVLGLVLPRAITALGGYRESPLGTRVAPIRQLPHGIGVTFQAFLELFGANVFNAKSAPELVFAVLHLAGVALVTWGLIIAARRFFRPGDLLVPVFAVAIVLNAVAYLTSPHAVSIMGAREMAAVLPLGAVLAGRTLGDRILALARAARRWFRPALALVVAGYLAALGYGAAQPAVPPANQPLAAWLVAHRFTLGLAGYWEANSTTLDSHGRVTVLAMARAGPDALGPYQWETDDADYDPSRHFANFVVAGGPDPLHGAQAAAVHAFGSPQRIYHPDGYTILVWDTNLLKKLA